MKNKKVLFAIFFFQFFLSVGLTYGNSNPIEYVAKKLYKENFKIYNKEKSTVDSVLHPLRVLVSASGCNPLNSRDHLRFNEGPNQDLIDAGCNLLDVFPDTAMKNSFKVYDYAMYPLLFFAKESQGRSVAFDGLINHIETVDQTEYYFLIGAQIDPEDRSLSFRTKLKLPSYGPYNRLNDQVLVEHIRSIVQDKIEDTYLIDNKIDSLPKAERVGIETLGSILDSLLNGSFGAELTEEMLSDFGFAELAGLPADYRLGNKDINSNDIVDYAGIEVGINNNWSYFRDNIAASINYAEITGLNLNLKFLITEDQNYATGEFEQARQKYHNTNAELQYWFHISIDTTNNANTRIFLNINNRITEEKGEEVFMNLYNDYLEIRDPEPNPAKPAAKTVTCPPKFSDFVSHPTTWTAKEYLLDCYGSCSDCISYSFLNDYWFGFASGGIDSIMESVNFFGMLGQGIYKALINDPPSLTNLGVAWSLDGIWRTGKKCVAESSWEVWNWEWDKNEEEVWREKFVESQEFWEGVHTMLEAIYDTKFYDIYQAIKSSLKVWYKDITGSNGSKAQGYTIGKSVCEVVLGIFTGGATLSTKAVAKSGKAAFGGLMKAIRDKNLGGLLDDAWQKLPSPQQLKCLISGKGCFVKDTPVLIAHNPFRNVEPVIALAGMPLVAPIQDVQVDDMVKAYHHEDMYLTASNNDDIYVPGWKDYDYLDITPDTWQIGKFIITEEDGSLVEIEANRPKKWFEDQGVTEVGNSTFLIMEEFGIFGNAELLELEATNIDTRAFKLNESGKVDRPVITTFKRIAQEISDYTFSNGQVISCTHNHPFYSSDRQAYLPIGGLIFGETVQTSSDREVKFIGGKSREKGEHVFNFEVWREHNYYVGFEGSEDFILVHNLCWVEIRKYIDDIADLHPDLLKAEIGDWWKSPFKPTVRGNMAEELLFRKHYSKNGWERLPDNFPGIDITKGNKGRNIKTISKDLSNVGDNDFEWTTIYKPYVDKLTNAFDPATGKYIFSKNGVTKVLDDVTLDLHVPKGFDLNKIKKLTDYAESKGLTPLISTIESKL